MKLIIELTEKQQARLQKFNIWDLPITSFLKNEFGFKSVEVVEAEKLNLQEVIYNMNNAQ